MKKFLCLMLFLYCPKIFSMQPPVLDERTPSNKESMLDTMLHHTLGSLSPAFATVNIILSAKPKSRPVSSATVIQTKSKIATLHKITSGWDPYCYLLPPGCDEYNYSITLLKKLSLQEPFIENDGEVLWELGYVSESKKNYRKAVDFYCKAIEWGNRTVQAKSYLRLGHLCFKNHASQAADEYFNKALQSIISPIIKATTLLELGNLYANAPRHHGATTKAIGFYKCATDQDDDPRAHVMALLKLGRIYTAQGKSEKAKEFLQKAAEQDFYPTVKQLAIKALT